MPQTEEEQMPRGKRRKGLGKKRGTLAMEMKYQSRRGWNMFATSDQQAYRTLRVASFPDYMKSSDASDIIGVKNLVENWSRLALPKAKAKANMLKYFNTASKAEALSGTRGEAIAQFMLQKKGGWGTLHRLPWARRDPTRERAEPRFGSSIGLFGGTTVTGAKRTKKDLESLIRTIQNMFQGLDKYPNITVTVTTSRY